MRSNKQRIYDGQVKDCLAFMDAYNDESLSDGAWQAMLQEGVEAFNESEGTDLDSHDMFIMWVQKRSK